MKGWENQRRKDKLPRKKKKEKTQGEIPQRGVLLSENPVRKGTENLMRKILCKKIP